MNKVITILILLSVAGCVVPLKLNKKIIIENIQQGFLIRLVKHKERIKPNKKIVIAVIDTGFDKKYKKYVNLCNDGHKSFVDDDPMTDNVPSKHGTHITGLIARNITVDYCLMILKYYKKDSYNNLSNTVKAINHAIEHRVDMINYSGGGEDSSPVEKKAIKRALDAGIIIVAAAGNEMQDLNEHTYFPAMYHDDIIVVGNLMRNYRGKVVRAPSSNHGKVVDVQVFGTDIRSLTGLLSGTSQSTAIVTGRIAKFVKVHKYVEFFRKHHKDSRVNYNSPLYKYMGK